MHDTAERAAMYDILCANIVAMWNGQAPEENAFFSRLGKQVNPRKHNYTPEEFTALVRVAAEMAANCRKCSGQMRPGITMGQTTYTGAEGTCSPAGPGYVRGCMKCEGCGWSTS